MKLLIAIAALMALPLYAQTPDLDAVCRGTPTADAEFCAAWRPRQVKVIVEGLLECLADASAHSRVLASEWLNADCPMRRE